MPDTRYYFNTDTTTATIHIDMPKIQPFTLTSPFLREVRGGWIFDSDLLSIFFARQHTPDGFIARMHILWQSVLIPDGYRVRLRNGSTFGRSRSPSLPCPNMHLIGTDRYNRESLIQDEHTRQDSKYYLRLAVELLTEWATVCEPSVKAGRTAEQIRQLGGV